jgi:AcrR family transcriptional regulator
MSPSTTATSGRRYASKTSDERRAERRQRLLDAGLDLLASSGHRGMTIEGLCAAANVSTRTFYEEFGSREALAIALHDDVNQRALEAVVAALADTDPTDIDERAQTAVKAYLEVMTRDRRFAHVALVETVGIGPEAEAHRRQAIERFVALIELEARRLAGLGLIPQRDHHLTAVALAGALNGLVNTWAQDPDWDTRLPQVASEAARLVARGLDSP